MKGDFFLEELIKKKKRRSYYWLAIIFLMLKNPCETAECKNFESNLQREGSASILYWQGVLSSGRGRLHNGKWSRTSSLDGTTSQQRVRHVFQRRPQARHCARLNRRRADVSVLLGLTCNYIHWQRTSRQRDINLCTPTERETLTCKNSYAMGLTRNW